MEKRTCFNLGFIDTDKLGDLYGDLDHEKQAESLNHTTNDVLINSTYDELTKNNKFNSFPMRKKNSTTAHSKSLKQAQKSFHNLNNLNTIDMSQDELMLNVRLAKTRPQENNRLKNLLRNNFWPADHPIRKYLWKCLLQTSNFHSNNKENNGLVKNQNTKFTDSSYNEFEYNKHLNQIFGKLREIDISLPDFVNMSEKYNPNGSESVTSATNKPNFSNNHLNYYFLNNKGKQAIKRILCVYEYHYPQVTFNPGLVSISSLLLHYMQEHEVFAALCFMSSTKEHLIESKSSWDTTCCVFTRLLKNYCRSSYEIISKYAIDSLDSIFNEWYWWIFDCLSFDYLVKIMDCFLYEGQKILYRVSLTLAQQFSRYIELIEECELIDEYFFDAVKSENIKVDKNSIKEFCESSANLESIDKLLKVSFSIRNLKRSTIKEYYTKEETKRKNYNANYDTKNQQNKALNTIENNQNSPTRIYLNEAMTSVLSHANLCNVWNWIPQRLSVCTPNMLFTTQEHGTSLKTLFNVLDELEYCLIVLKTFENEIFGAFCAGDWNERKNPKTLYFGTGETFLFSLNPDKKVYKWVGLKTETKANQEMFIRVDSNKIIIGGGNKEGLAIKSNLLEGVTNRCDTFENEPLCSSVNFQIAILEIVGFSSR